MKAVKNLLIQLPEILLIIAIFIYWISSGVTLNPVAIVIIALLIIQIFYKNKTLGIILASTIIILGLYMTGALMSELNEFPVFNAEAKKLLIYGMSLFVSTIVVSAIMIYKYVLKSNNQSNK